LQLQAQTPNMNGSTATLAVQNLTQTISPQPPVNVVDTSSSAQIETMSSGYTKKATRNPRNESPIVNLSAVDLDSVRQCITLLKQVFFFIKRVLGIAWF
jgi:hypothetical protein